MTLRQIKAALEERYRLPGLLAGMASVLDLSGETRNPIRRYRQGLSDAELDAAAIYEDWKAVGDSFRFVMAQVDDETEDRPAQATGGA